MIEAKERKGSLHAPSDTVLLLWFYEMRNEVIRCSTGKNELAEKKEEKEEETKVVKMEEKKSSSSDFPMTLLKLIAQYVVPILKKFGINLSSICKMIFPDLVYCDIIDFLA